MCSAQPSHHTSSPMFVLVSSDNQKLLVDKAILMQCTVFQNLLQGACICVAVLSILIDVTDVGELLQEIPVHNISSSVLLKVNFNCSKFVSFF